MERIKQENGYGEVVTFNKFISMSPASCREPIGRLDRYDRSGSVRMFKSFQEEATVGGQKRIYNVTVWEVKHGGKTYLLMAEFVSPLASMAKAEVGMQTQISQRYKVQTKQQFDELLRSEINEGKAKDGPLHQHCCLFTFEGKV